MSATLYRARALDVPDGPLGGAVLRSDEDLALLVRDGVIEARGGWAEVSRLPASREAATVDLRDGVLLPGFVDTHVHFPQVRVIGGLGKPLLDWLQTCALPEEARMIDRGYAHEVAADLLSGLASSGTTSALVFGAHDADAVDVLFTAAEASGLRITAGLVTGDRLLREELHTDPETAFRQGLDLASRWHGRGRLRYAVTPRFSLAASDAMLASSRALLDAVEGSLFTTHINENGHEIAAVAELFPGSRDYLDTYERHGLVTPRSVLAHNVHPTTAELARLAATGASVAHCPTSNASLGSGLFPMREHVEAGVRVALGSDVGGGSGFCLLKEMLQAYFAQQLLGPAGLPLSPADLLHLATTAGAQALGLDQVGHLGEGMAFDAVLIRPPVGSTLDTVLRHAEDALDALAKIIVLGTPADIASVWVGGQVVNGCTPTPFTPKVPLTTSP
ncbi:guanine deaminase [Pseudactinotalea suaedae]|uniref:guanine deaminase n=1 Tax=Pseudactinotalea suaedae TaxID=1524924 RepID=UPI0012E2AD8C|nr:guanine deaminase [Pseudactinotalea suaedae]